MTLHQAAQKAVGALAKEQILHLWDMHVGEPTEHAPLTDKDKLAFARAVLYAAASPSTTQQPSVDHALNTTPVVDHATQQQEAGSTAARDVLAERARQISAEGWTAEHDDEHGDGQLAFAASCYAQHASARAWMFGSLDDAAERYAADDSPDDWPDSWDTNWWKPKNPRRDLVRAAALLLAEIERMDRAAAPSTPAREEALRLAGAAGGPDHG